MNHHDVRYFQSEKTKWVGNILERTKLKKWEVHGAFLPTTYYRTEKAAAAECAYRENLPPFTPPIGKRTGK
jgi:hypothetical protein